MMCLRIAVLALTLLGTFPPCVAQEQTPVPGETSPEFVSGFIAELPPGKIVVNRALSGKSAEMRTFIINGETKVEGKLRQKARVTVGFKPSDEGDIAVRIIVRGQQHP